MIISQPPISTLWHGIIVLGDPSKNQDHDVSRICQMMVPCATGEYAGGGTECIGHHDQGIFYSNGGTIRYANVGVSVGDEMNPYEYGASDYIPSGSQAGGIIYIKNSTFYNCKRASITFAAYRDAFQQSLIENNTFIYDFKTVVGLTESTERFIYAYGNNFKHPISSNGFYNKMDLPTDLYFNHAVQTGNSHIILDDNYFEGDNLGAQVHAFDFMSAPFATTRYYSNEFKTRISESIGLNSVDNCWITSNAINTVDYGRGIHSFKANNVNIINNTITSTTTTSNIDCGIRTTSTNLRSILVQNNSISKFHRGLEMRSNNSSTLVKCNNMQNNRSSDIYGAAGSVIGNQGFPSQPAGNTFSLYGSGAYDIYNLGGNFNYYYKNISGHYPGTVTNVSRTQSLASLNCTGPFTGFIYPYSCFADMQEPVNTSGQWLANGNEYWTQYSNLSEGIDDLENDGIDSTNEDEYHIKLVEYDLTLGYLMSHYAEAYAGSDSCVSPSYLDSIEVLLTNHHTFNGPYYLAQFYIALNEFGNAAQVLSDIESNYSGTGYAEEFVEYMELVADYAESEYATAWLTTYFPAVKVIADNDNHFMTTQAKVLCNIAAGLDSTNNWYGDTVYYLNETNSDSVYVEPEPDPQIDVVIYPNPFTSALNVEITDESSSSREFVVEIVSFISGLMDSDNLNVNADDTNSSEFNTSTYNSGYYIVRVKEGGNLVYDAIVFKQ